MRTSQPRDQPSKMGVNKSVIETVNVPKFKEGRYTFPESIATLQPQRVEGDELLYDGYLTEAGKTTGKVFFTFRYMDDDNYDVTLNKTASGVKNYNALVKDGAYIDNIQEAIENAVYEFVKDELHGWLQEHGENPDEVKEIDEDMFEKAVELYKSPSGTSPQRSQLRKRISGGEQTERPISAKRKKSDMSETQAEAMKIAGLNTRIQNLLTRIDEMKDEDQAGKIDEAMTEYRSNLADVAKTYKKASMLKVLEAVSLIQSCREEWAGVTYDMPKYNKKTGKKEVSQRGCLTDLAELLRLSIRYLAAPNKELLQEEAKELIQDRSRRTRLLADLKDKEQLEQLGLNVNKLNKDGEIHIAGKYIKK
jgi:hypothetical protein